MRNINILKALDSTDKVIDLITNSLPKGKLYGDSFRAFFKSFCESYFDLVKSLQEDINGLFTIDANSKYLEELKTEYGLPNVIFPDITTNEQAAFAINVMGMAPRLLSQQDFINFMLLLGYNVTFYNLNEATIEFTGLNSSFPMTFSESISTKDKLTFWVYIEKIGAAETIDYNGLGDAFNIEFTPSGSDISYAKSVLDFLCPDYLKFQYITSYTKQLYGL